MLEALIFVVVHLASAFYGFMGTGFLVVSVFFSFFFFFQKLLFSFSQLENFSFLQFRFVHGMMELFDNALGIL